MRAIPRIVAAAAIVTPSVMAGCADARATPVLGVPGALALAEAAWPANIVFELGCTVKAWPFVVREAKLNVALFAGVVVWAEK